MASPFDPNQLLLGSIFSSEPWCWFKGKNPADILLTHFHERRPDVEPRWNIKPSRSISHQFELPAIVISDEDVSETQENTLDGYLGLYEYHLVGTHSTLEGRVVLNRRNIAKTAAHYQNYIAETSKAKLDDIVVFQSLTKIVLIHELGHWIHHYVATDKEPFFQDFGIESTDIKEAFAQIITHHSCVNDIDKNIFDFILKNRLDDDPYMGHKKLMQHGCSSIACAQMILLAYRNNNSPLYSLDKFMNNHPPKTTLLKNNYGV